jgi:hypothetical protein
MDYTRFDMQHIKNVSEQLNKELQIGAYLETVVENTIKAITKLEDSWIKETTFNVLGYFPTTVHRTFFDDWHMETKQHYTTSTRSLFYKKDCKSILEYKICPDGSISYQIQNSVDNSIMNGRISPDYVSEKESKAINEKHFSKELDKL